MWCSRRHSVFARDWTTINSSIFSSLDVLPVDFNAVFTLSGLSFYGQLLEQVNIALLSRRTVFLQCYGQIPLHQFPRSKSVTSWRLPRNIQVRNKSEEVGAGKSPLCLLCRVVSKIPLQLYLLPTS